MGNETFLPKISGKNLAKITDDWDFLFAILDLYYDEMEKNGEKSVFSRVNDHQAILLIFNDLYGQVTNGGFIQLIYNGYDFSVFESEFINLLEPIGITKIRNILERAKIFYEKYREKFENINRENWDDFAELYKKCPEFEKLDEEFYEVMDAEVSILKNFVEKNLSDFVTMVA
jgi:hypothetical protein